MKMCSKDKKNEIVVYKSIIQLSQKTIDDLRINKYIDRLVEKDIDCINIEISLDGNPYVLSEEIETKKIKIF